MSFRSPPPPPPPHCRSVYVCVYVYVWVGVCVSMHVCVRVYVTTLVLVCGYIFLYMCGCVCVFLCLWVGGVCGDMCRVQSVRKCIFVAWNAGKRCGVLKGNTGLEDTILPWQHWHHHLWCSQRRYGCKSLYEVELILCTKWRSLYYRLGLVNLRILRILIVAAVVVIH